MERKFNKQPTTYELEQLRNENLQQKEKIRHQQNELEQLRHEQSQLKTDIEHKGEKIGQLTYGLKQLEQKIQQKENEIARLKQDLQITRSITSKMVETNNDLMRKNDELGEEKKWLFNRIEQLKCKECDKNCVIDTMLWICQNKTVDVDVELCRRQLEKIIIAYAGNKIKKEDLKCEQLMEILLGKCQIVTIAEEYKYPFEINAKVQVIDEAWNRLMTTDGNERVLILGGMISTANDQGHAEVCDLDTRSDGKVIIQDPQKEVWGLGNQQDFRNHVMKDEGLILYSVNIEKLRQIIKEYKDILHITNKFEQTLTIPPGAIDEFQ